MREQNLSSILNQNFIQRVEKDMENHDILYLFAPLGWEKEIILKRICEKIASQESVFHGDFYKVESISGTVQDERTDKSITLNISNIDI